MAGECEDVPGQGCGLEPFELRVHAYHGAFTHVLATDGALMRGGREVVSLGHFRAVALLEHELLLRQQGVREHPVEFPDLIQHGPHGQDVVAVVTDQLAHVGRVLPARCGHRRCCDWRATW